MSSFGTTIIAIGVIIVLLGLAVSGYLGPLGRLPGDITISRDGFTLYIPITTMLIISIVVSVTASFFR